MKNPGLILLLGLLLSQCRPKPDNTITNFAGKPAVPAAIKSEHEKLLNATGKIAQLTDSTGRAAAKLKELMLHHFKEEEDYVLPPLGCLPALTTGNLPAKSNEVIALTEKLKTQLNHMSAEHQLIKAYMQEVIQAAATENHPEAIALEQELSKHATMEEEVLFPAAILVGEYLKIKDSGQ
jgi:hypothetical protein